MHINKTLLKIISGIAKVWVGEIVEDAKEWQVKESLQLKKAVDGDKETQEEDVDEQIKRETLYREIPLQPYHLKTARDEYERKRNKYGIKIFNTHF